MNDFHLKFDELIKQHEVIILHRHILPDGDAFGSQLGLKELIKTNYPSKKVYAVGNDIEYLKFIGTMNHDVTDDLYKDALVVVTDCGNIERIDDQRFSHAKHIVKIDHHPDATPFGDSSWVDTSFTSASEMVGYLAMQLHWKVTPEAGRIVYHGILTDSIRFLIQATTSRTLKVASWLLESGFDLAKLHAQMYRRSLNDLKLNAELINSAVIEDRVGYIILTDELIHKYQLRYDENGKFANLLKDIDGVDIWITFAFREDKRWRVEFRSKEIAINQIAVQWGGGGHKLASGAIVDTLDQAMQIVSDTKKIIN